MPIIMLTARGEESERVRGLATGADDYVVKPFSTPELMARVRELAEQYEVPLDEDNMVIEREERRFHVNGWYDKEIEVAPNYFYPWHFGLSLDAVKPATYAVTP